MSWLCALTYLGGALRIVSSTDEALQSRLWVGRGPMRSDGRADEDEGQDLNEWKGTQLPGVGAA